MDLTFWRGGKNLKLLCKSTCRISQKLNTFYQPCLTLCNPKDCSPSDSSLYGIPQARILEWVAITFSRGSFQPRDWTWVSCIVGRFFTIRASTGALNTIEKNKAWQLSEGINKGECRTELYHSGDYGNLHYKRLKLCLK